MQDDSLMSEFEVDRNRYSDITGSLEKISSPDPRNLDVEVLKDTFEWEKERFIKLDAYVTSGFGHQSSLFEELVGGEAQALEETG